MWIFRWLLSRSVRHATDATRQVWKLLNAQRDQLSPEASAEVEAAWRATRAVIRQGGGPASLEQSLRRLEEIVGQRLHPYPHARWRENIEVFLVTIAVVVALRTFFFQPMAIPSGSAQPTLWGITEVNLLESGAEAPMPRGLAWLGHAFWSGTRYYHKTARNGGVLTRVDPPRHVFPFIKRQSFYIGRDRYTLWLVPDDVVKRAKLLPGQRFAPGEDILKLKVVSGDHLFVNRMIYNFRRPRRGEIIVFSSHGIRGLIPDTHYIKRLVALGGETVSLGDDRHLRINGRRLDASDPGFENVYGFNPSEPPQDSHYSGHVNGSVARRYARMNFAPLLENEASTLRVRPRHYLAFGDNTMNSHDGRAWGDFPQEKVIGRAGFVFWPISPRFGWGYR